MKDLSSLAAPGSEAGELLERLDRSRLPRHVAIIMDGNGRWARKRHLPRVAGHRAGIRSVRETVEGAARLGLEVLTLYAFSQENWKRPRTEIDTLMDLLQEYLRKELKTLHEHRIRFRVLGRIRELRPEIQAELEAAIRETADHDGLLFNIALSYGGRAEIVDALRAVVRDGVPPEGVDEAAIASRLYTAGQPDPDLLIRTSGEMRVSNFLLWQIAYAEIHVTPTLWPDFRFRHLLAALLDYQGRERRYGGIGDAPTAAGAAAAARGSSSPA